jgi:hypothetical protein
MVPSSAPPASRPACAPQANAARLHAQVPRAAAASTGSVCDEAREPQEALFHPRKVCARCFGHRCPACRVQRARSEQGAIDFGTFVAHRAAGTGQTQSIRTGARRFPGVSVDSALRLIAWHHRHSSATGHRVHRCLGLHRGARRMASRRPARPHPPSCISSPAERGIRLLRARSAAGADAVFARPPGAAAARFPEAAVALANGSIGSVPLRSAPGGCRKKGKLTIDKLLELQNNSGL